MLQCLDFGIQLWQLDLKHESREAYNVPCLGKDEGDYKAVVVLDKQTFETGKMTNLLIAKCSIPIVVK